MTMCEPSWFDYIEWDYSDPSFPVFVKLRDDTPEEIRKEYEEFCKWVEEHPDEEL